MGRTTKEQKAARRERHAQLREASLRVQERLLRERRAGADKDDAVEYVLPPSEDDVSTAATTAQEAKGSDKAKTTTTAATTAATHKSTTDGSKSGEDEDRVHLPAAPRDKAHGRGATATAAAAQSRKRRKMTWQGLKVAVTSRYGAAAAERVEEHDCNADDPLFTVYLKMQRRVVPVPRHWQQLRSFLSHQADREAPVGVVPPEIEALGVARVRATKDKKANLNQVAFMTCFLTGTPLQLRRFAAPLTRFGETFYEGKWMPKVACCETVGGRRGGGGGDGGVCPGVLSTRLRQALGMTAAHTPPPWLYSLQAMRRLPPAYPELRIAGLNAPIPPGAQWGHGQGQWGEPPRGDNHAFLFPGVMDEVAGDDGGDGGDGGGGNGGCARQSWWGTVPRPSSSTSAAAAAAAMRSSAAATAAAAPAVAARPASSVTAATAAAAKTVVVTPVPFVPQSYVHQPSLAAAAAAATTVAPQEYVRVQDSASDATTIAVSHVLVPKSAVVPEANKSNTR